MHMRLPSLRVCRYIAERRTGVAIRHGLAVAALVYFGRSDPCKKSQDATTSRGQFLGSGHRSRSNNAIEKVHIPPLKTQGIKTKLVPWIARCAAVDVDTVWVEPFMGSGSSGFNLAPKRAIFSDTEYPSH